MVNPGRLLQQLPRVGFRLGRIPQWRSMAKHDYLWELMIIINQLEIRNRQGVSERLLVEGWKHLDLLLSNALSQYIQSC